MTAVGIVGEACWQLLAQKHAGVPLRLDEAVVGGGFGGIMVAGGLMAAGELVRGVAWGRAETWRVSPGAALVLGMIAAELGTLGFNNLVKHQPQSLPDALTSFAAPVVTAAVVLGFAGIRQRILDGRTVN